MASGRSGLTKVLRGNRDVSDAAAMRFTPHSQEWLCYWCCATGAVLRRGFAAAPNWAVGTDDNGADLRYKDAGPSSHPTSSFAHVPRSILPYCCAFVCTCAAGGPTMGLERSKPKGPGYAGSVALPLRNRVELHSRIA